MFFVIVKVVKCIDVHVIALSHNINFRLVFCAVTSEVYPDGCSASLKVLLMSLHRRGHIIKCACFIRFVLITNTTVTHEDCRY